MGILNIDNTTYFSDFSFSFTPHPKTGDITILKNSNAIKNSLRNLLKTKAGDILFQSSLGCGIHNILFEPIDYITINTMKNDIETTIKNFEPRVKLISINIEESREQNGIYITLQFNIVNQITTETISVFLERIR